MTKKLIVVLQTVLLLVLLAGCAKKQDEEIHGFEKWELKAEKYLEFQDGQIVQEWCNTDLTQRRYQLEDGTELMHVTVRIGLAPETDKKGLVGLDDMSQEAQTAVKEYYRKQGEVFDTKERLNIAYQDYCNCGRENEHFTPHEISQEVMPTAESERFIAFLTAVIQPKEDHFMGDTITVYDSVLFDRKTGDILDIKDLFSVPWDEVEKELSSLCGTEDTTVTDFDIYDVMDQADILLFQDYLEVWIPYGTWERQEFDKGFGLKYDKLTDMLQPWAMPIGSE